MEVPCPVSFDYDAEKWPAWKARFTRFRAASDLSTKSEARQINMLIYCMGEKAEDILTSFRLSTEDAAKYDKVLEAFDAYFVIRKNIVYERAQFNSRRQLPGEPAGTFVTALNKLADTCEYGTLRDQLVRDRLVVGIADARLSEELQLDSTLTLEKAVTAIRQAELVYQQQDVLRGGASSDREVMQVRGGKPQKQHKPMHQDQRQYQKHDTQASSCKWCGRHSAHPRSSCPAKDASCRKCQRKVISSQSADRPQQPAIEAKSGASLSSQHWTQSSTAEHTMPCTWTRLRQTQHQRHVMSGERTS